MYVHKYLYKSELHIKIFIFQIIYFLQITMEIEVWLISEMVKSYEAELTENFQ